MTGVAHPPDHFARQRAVTDLGTNLVVLAGAGTGKTSLLVERVLVAIGLGHLELRDLAAITFTEKAAGEMRARLGVGLDRLRRLALGEAAEEGGEAERALRYLADDAGIAADTVAERALAGLRSLSEARVSTIHGLCSEILRSFPMEAGVSPEFRVDMGERFDAFLEKEWETFLTGELGPDAPRGELWRSLLEQVPLPAVRPLAFALARLWSLDPADAAARGGEGLRKALAERAGRLAVEIGLLLARQTGMTARTEAFFRTMERGLAAVGDGGLDAFHALLRGDDDLANQLARDKAPGANKKLEGVSGEELERLAAAALRFLAGLAAADDDFGPVVEAVAPFARSARERFLARGEVIADGLLALCRDLLRDHPDVRRRLKLRFRALLVDEFQDTDPLQYEIVLFLAERDEAQAADAYRTELGPGRLFIVGDPKQSIYRFRGADYSAFLQAVRRVRETGGEELDLTANFRSLPEVVEPINALFTGAGSSWAPSPYQPDYVELQATRPAAGDEPRVELWRMDGGDDSDVEERRAREGRSIAAWIHGQVTSGTLSYGRITILLRAFTSVASYLRPLRRWGIPFVADGGRGFIQRPEVGHLMAALRALARPSDPVALLAYLRSPAGAVPDSQLLAFAEEGGRWDRGRRDLGEDAGRHPDLHRALELLRELEEKTRGLAADAMVRRVLHGTRLLPLGAAAYDGAQRVANLRKLASVAGHLARDGSLSLNEVLDALEDERVSEVEGDSPVADEGTDAVRVLTIHKAKGLESDVIVVPDLGRAKRYGGGPGGPSPVKFLRTDLGESLPGLAMGGARNLARVLADEEERDHEDAEGTRLLYVALTRARERLVLLAGDSRGKAPWTEALRAWGYDPERYAAEDGSLAGGRVVVRTVRGDERSSPGAPRDATPVKAAAEAHGEAVALLNRAVTPGLFRHPSGEAHGRRAAAGDEEAEPAPTGPAEVGRLVGLVVHRLLELWDGGRQTLLERIEEVTEGILGDEGPRAMALHREVAAETRDLLAGFPDSPLAERFRRASIQGREVPLLFRDDHGVTWRGTLDLLYRDPAGDLVVADYKTDRDLDDERARERYAAQLAVYARAVRRALELEALPRAEIWLIRRGSRVTVPEALLRERSSE